MSVTTKYGEPYWTRLSEELVERLDAIAAQEKRTRASQMAMLIEQGVERYEQEHAEPQPEPVAAPSKKGK